MTKKTPVARYKSAKRIILSGVWPYILMNVQSAMNVLNKDHAVCAKNCAEYR